MSDQEAFPLPEQQPPSSSGSTGSYRVLARAYRPQKFSEMVGQEALVRTLSNAMRTGRIAHAFLLTGIRGVGKTTTARIIARALNCIGPDGNGGPTPEPCGVCQHCRAIAEGRHIDILEMDAATHTGIDDIRELVDSVRYAPTSARYKVYIVDEVHMLSEKAFNGLLKTLEEPPPQTLFIFATTEVRKVPITVLSRCQRFDLRRIEADVLHRYFKTISEREGFQIEDSALALIARAAEGSARDGLSLLDQAIALSGGTQITITQVQDMLGLADRKRLLDLFEQIMRGQVPDALGTLADLYERGAEPEAVVQDLLEISHWLTRLKVAGGTKETTGTSAWDAERSQDLASNLSLATLSRAWQMLLKGLDDLRIAPSPLLAAEMLIIRLAHAADLPSAEAMLAMLKGEGGPPTGDLGNGGGMSGNTPPKAGAPSTGAAAQAVKPSIATPSPLPTEKKNSLINGARPSGDIQASGTPAPCTPPPKTNGTTTPPSAPRTINGTEQARPPKSQGRSSDSTGPGPAVHSFAEVVDLFRQRKKPLLHGWLHGRARLVTFEPGKITLEKGDQILAERRQEMTQLLREWTGEPWQIQESEAEGAPSLTDQEAEAKRLRLTELADDPRVKPVLDIFPGAKIVDVQAPMIISPDNTH